MQYLRRSCYHCDGVSKLNLDAHSFRSLLLRMFAGRILDFWFLSGLHFLHCKLPRFLLLFYLVCQKFFIENFPDYTTLQS